jgi:restriction system protein
MVPMYIAEVIHPGLNKFHVLRGSDPEVLRQKAKALSAQWDEMWTRRQEAEKKRLAREAQARGKEQMLALAETKTQEANEAIRQLEQTLAQVIGTTTEIQWDRLKDRREFPKSRPEPQYPMAPYIPDPELPPAPREPTRPEIPKKPTPPDISEKVSRDDPRFQPTISFSDRIIPGRAKQKIQEAEALFSEQLEAWENKVIAYNEQVKRHNAYLVRLKQVYAEEKAEYRTLRAEYEAECKRITEEHPALVEREERKYAETLERIRTNYLRSLGKWEEEKRRFDDERNNRNAAIDQRRENYLACIANDVIEYCDTILSDSKYPDYFPQNFELDYIEQVKTLLVDYYLPALDGIPNTKAWKYVQSTNTLSSTKLPETSRNKLYDDLVCQVALRSLYELFVADSAGALDSIVFNGRIKSIDPATGLPFDACILSVHVKKQEFIEINLALVEPRACIKKLKGVASSKLHQMAPVAPILQMDRHDKRFVESYEVAERLDDSVNLAAMDWEDFEHLIREIFEKEFSSSGGEVRVTQASRDGGVDAVAFDPDPIRGGKIVIQAKRYTNPVGVSAVRDLYGTVMNEGAIKGILVTTSNYGPDAFEFAKGKPLTLLDGANLLHLLDRHGHRAKIDIGEARKTAAFREKQS